VSLRLYARGWGPAAICHAVNTHRVVEPEYLRNTCSVKCTTAIKKGRDRYGDEWESYNRAILSDKGTTDEKATDMIRLGSDELANASDFDVRALCNGLRMHPNSVRETRRLTIYRTCGSSHLFLTLAVHRDTLGLPSS
jgi:hypothetical protein